MPYVKKTVVAGDTIEVEKYYTARWSSPLAREGARQHKNQKTTEAQLRVNERLAEKRLRLLINANFGKGDLHLTLTYQKENRPGKEQARANLEKFIRKARKVYRKEGQELRYITVTEFENAAIHHHVIFPGIDVRHIVDLWEEEHGAMRVKYLDGRKNHAELAAYLIKETRKTFRQEGRIYGKRYNASKNLHRPVEKVENISANTWSKEPRGVKGYHMDKDSYKEGYHEITGYGFQRYILVRDDPQKNKGGKRG